MVDWGDPVSRLALIDRIGPAAYNEAFRKHMADSTVATVNGYPIRPVPSRFGRLFSVDGANVAFRTQAEAEAHAATLPERTA